MIKGSNRLETVSEYYFSKKLREVSVLNQSGKSVINMGIGSPDLFPSKDVIKALKKSLNHKNAHKYQSYQGMLELRNSISKFYFKYFGVKSNPENEVLPLIGSTNLNTALAIVLLPDPLSPTKPKVSPELISKFTPSTALTSFLFENNFW